MVIKSLKWNYFNLWTHLYKCLILGYWWTSYKNEKTATAFNANDLNEVHLVESSKSHRLYRVFTPPKIKPSKALKRHKSQGFSKPIRPALNVPAEKRGLRYGINACCNYRLRKSQFTFTCLALKYTIQDLIDDRTKPS